MANENQTSELSTIPASVEVSNREQILKIEWSDGHISIYPLFGLRKNCPCVKCRGGHSRMGSFEMELFTMRPASRYEIVKAEPVGNHALKILWDDGHDSGMYRWDLLRSMCPGLKEKNSGSP